MSRLLQESKHFLELPKNQFFNWSECMRMSAKPYILDYITAIYKNLQEIGSN